VLYALRIRKVTSFSLEKEMYLYLTETVAWMWIDADFQQPGVSLLILITIGIESRSWDWYTGGLSIVIPNCLISCRVITMSWTSGEIRVLTVFMICEIHLDLLLDGGSCCHMERLLDWSRSASARRCGLEAVDEGYLRIGGGGGFRTGPWEQVYVFCYWTRITILTGVKSWPLQIHIFLPYHTF